MKDALPDPSLPLFSDKEVSYTLLQRSAPGRLTGEQVRLSVDEIDRLEDPELRRALWEQFSAKESDGNRAVFPFVHENGRFSHVLTGPTRPLNVTFTSDGVVENKDLNAYREQKANERMDQEHKASGWIARLFKRQR